MARTGTGAPVSETNLARLAAELRPAGAAWLRRLRREALERFEQLGLPAPHDEQWRQTNVAPIARTRFRRAPAGATRDWGPDHALADLGCPTVVVVDGRFAPALSSISDLPGGLRVEGLAAAIESRPGDLEGELGRHAGFEQRAFTALNTAAFEDGVLVTVTPGTVPGMPLHVVHRLTAADAPLAVHPRILVIAGPNSQVSLVESYLGPRGAVYLTNAVTEIVLGENAALEHARIQYESRAAFHVGAVQVRQARHSRYVGHNVSFGAALARHDVGSVLDGDGAEATFNGLYLASGDQHVDNHTILDHARPHCPSHELYKGILAGRAHAVFNGLIIVRPGAQKTDAKQSNKNMLLTNDALIHTRPQLEIYADDVKCTHGATIGHLEEDALFYLRSRGVGLGQARAILIHGFAGEVVDRITYAPLRDRLVAEAVGIMSRELVAESAT